MTLTYLMRLRHRISGQWMTANEMAQEFAGLPERVPAPPGRQKAEKSPAVNLYLPE